MEEPSVVLRPRPDEMTFEQVLKHVMQAMYWDPVDGVWCDVGLHTREGWDVLADQIEAAHEREISSLKAENDTLRWLAERVWFAASRLCVTFPGPCSGRYDACPMGERDEECIFGRLARELRKLGIEVD